jgi:hypothetical protein
MIYQFLNIRLQINKNPDTALPNGGTVSCCVRLKP